MKIPLSSLFSCKIQNVTNVYHQSLLIQDDDYIMSSKKNHTVRPELSSPVLSDSLQKPEKHFDISKLNTEIQIPCLLSGKRELPCQQVFAYGESAVSFSNW